MESATLGSQINSLLLIMAFLALMVAASAVLTAAYAFGFGWRVITPMASGAAIGKLTILFFYVLYGARLLEAGAHLSEWINLAQLAALVWLIYLGVRLFDGKRGAALWLSFASFIATLLTISDEEFASVSFLLGLPEGGAPLVQLVQTAMLIFVVVFVVVALVALIPAGVRALAKSEKAAGRCRHIGAVLVFTVAAWTMISGLSDLFG